MGRMYISNSPKTQQEPCLETLLLKNTISELEHQLSQKTIVEVPVERIVTVEVTVEKIIEVPVERIVTMEVPVERIVTNTVERIVEIPKETFVDRVVSVEKLVVPKWSIVALIVQSLVIVLLLIK